MFRDLAKQDRLAAKLPSLSVVPKPNPRILLSAHYFANMPLAVLGLIGACFFVYIKNAYPIYNYEKRTRYQAEFDLASATMRFRHGKHSNLIHNY